MTQKVQVAVVGGGIVGCSVMLTIALNFPTSQQEFESVECADLNRLFKPSDF